ncbi:Dam family site-specific DNA-(adenine-N6)-methyltransferase [Granulicella sp. L46]|uniref:DNA adenine methylase n=1 Tax=Granulicella sp. L46 TaxID=1641865 RepID=UPI00131BE6C0|nr:Dam family site-specific DNA-(adenine-N6)-methyltransferase [Granulicella sp. L46]
MSELPFLKWAGGKRWLAPRLRAIFGDTLHSRLVEPFVGSGAAFFHLRPKQALLADSNEELIAAFRAVRDTPALLLQRLGSMQINKDVFDLMRDSRPRTDANRAVRLIYLNRTAYNGLYRVNQNNKFNVPFGCKPGTKLCDPSGINGASEALRNAAVKCQDFRETLDEVSPRGDIVYVDPPYTVKHDNNGFRRYNNRIFSWEDQEDLARILQRLAMRGSRIIISNAHHADVRKLYSNALFHAIEVERTTCMAATSAGRGSCIEWLLVSRTIDLSRARLRRKLES